MYRTKRILGRILSLLTLGMLLAGCSSLSTGTTTTASTTATTATVKTITAVSSVSGSGSVTALQTVSVAWKTAGTVGAVKVKSGDQVKAGDVLMTIDPQSASTAMLQAQAELSSSVKALNDLLNPTALAVADAQQAVVKAQDDLDSLLKPTAVSIADAKQVVAQAQATLDTAKKTLANSKAVDLKYYQDQVQSAQDALTNAQQNTTATDIGSLPVQLRQAQDQLAAATNIYNNAKEAFAKCPACLTVFAYDRNTTWQDAVNLYTDATNKVAQIQMQIDQAQRQNTSSVSTAQDNLDTANRNLAAALQGPDTVTVQVNQAAVSVAEAALADAQDKLNKLLNPTATDIAVAQATLATAKETLARLQTPDATEVITAQAQVAAAQDAVEAYTLKAPVDGEVLAVNYQSGDVASQGSAAVTLANRSQVRVDALVDESDIGKVVVGNPVTITVDALSDLAIPGTVTWINPTGTSSSGLVKYTVQIDSSQANSHVLLGMSASVVIVTDTKTGALAVPLAAVQYDTQGEYVNRIKSDGTLERVTVKSGQIQNGQVIIEGNVKNGDQVSLTSTASTTTTSASSSNAGGPGGLGGLTGGGEPPSSGGPQP